MTLAIGADPFLHPEPHAGLRKRNRILIIAACGLALVALLSVLVLWFVNGVAQTLGAGVGKAVANAEQNGIVEASEVAAFAHSEGISLGAVTVQDLQSRYPGTHWLMAPEASIPTNGTNSSVSVDVEGSHALTAVQALAGMCSYGLALQSNSDPIVESDGLPGAGTFYAFAPLSHAPVGPSTCSAATAPTSGWTKAPIK